MGRENKMSIVKILYIDCNDTWVLCIRNSRIEFKLNRKVYGKDTKQVFIATIEQYRNEKFTIKYSSKAQWLKGE